MTKAKIAALWIVSSLVVEPLIFLGLLAIVGWARRPRRADAHT